MKRKSILAIGVAASLALGLGVTSLRAYAQDQKSQEEKIDAQALKRAIKGSIEAQLRQSLESQRGLLAGQISAAIEQGTAEAITGEIANFTEAQIRAALARTLWQEQQERGQELRGEVMPRVAVGEPLMEMDGEESGWLGVTPEEVSADRAKELKLSSPRGVYLGEVEKDSPAEKGGLKSGDVITEFNGQHVEGVAQFRRLVRETPSGRTVSIAVWREGRSQTVSVTLGDGEGQFRMQFNRMMPRMNVRVTPMPAMPPMPPMPNMREFNYDWSTDGDHNFVFLSRTPTLGISAEDLSGQLGSYFGAPDGAGILVKEVQSGSPAEKGGLKAGDVITKINGDRVKTVSEMQSKLREKKDEKTAQVTVMRKGSETTLTVEPNKPATAPTTPRVAPRPVSRRITL